MPSGSKTSLGSLIFSLDNLPTFYVTEIETMDSDDEQCLSRKLRCSAIGDFLKTKNFFFPYAVNHNAKRNQLNPSPFYNKDNKGPIDYLIIPCQTKGDLETWVQNSLEHHNSGVKLHDKEARRDLTGELQYRAIYCRFKSGARIVSPNATDDMERKLYARCLDTFVCTRVNKRKDWVNGTNPANKDWILDKSLGSIDPVLKTKGLAQYCSVRTHAEPVLNLDAKELHLKLDLALCLDKSIEAPDLLFEYLGNNVLGSISAEQLSLIKGVLVGLEVRYLDPQKNTYSDTDKPNGIIQTAPRTSQRLSVSRTLRKTPSIATFGRTPVQPIYNLARPDTPVEVEYQSSKQDQSTTQKVATYRIQDIRSSVEVSRFLPQRAKADGTFSISEDTEEKPISVAAYFETFKNSKLKYPNLPLVKVRHDTWIPLEFLEVIKGQALRNTGHLTDFVKMASLNFADLNQHQNDSFAAIDEEENPHLKGQAQERLPIFKRGPLNFVSPAKVHTRPTPKSSEAESKSPERLESEPVQARLIYIPSNSADTAESESFLTFVARGLHQATGSESSAIKFSKPKTTLIEVEKPLLLERFMNSEEANDVLIVVVDHSGRTKGAVDQIRAEVHRYAEQIMGCIAVCISKQDLERSFHTNVPIERKTYAKHSYFPKGLLRKINLMLGGTNYKSALETEPLEALSTQMRDIAKEAGKAISHADSVGNAMIFGAHVSHPGSIAGVSCPSVAAVVATDNNTVHYLGAARVQPTVRETTQRRGYGGDKPGIKHSMQSRILGLKSMIRERLLNSSDPSPSVIFFRHGLDPNLESGVIEKEKADIKEAFEDYFDPKPIKLTYIVVTNNSFVVPTDQLVVSSGFAIEQTSKPKYWYSIEGDDLEIPTRLLRGLVKRLNQRNQLGAEVSIALPIHFAQKLARRVFDYFHFYATDSASLVPSILGPTSYKERKDGYITDRAIKQIIENQIYSRGHAGAVVSDEEVADQGSTQNDPGDESPKNESINGEKKGDTEDTEVEQHEKAEIGIINSIVESPWKRNLSNQMFYL
ncbi:uncharacterized protein N0V89_003206 [Didymosphaeria variabile]|uniref:Piwi domain-containing protein n=1 Tax=Didymosphaeria variabile TaxID=1932322 RepID=A0A9W8XWA3_9PLEO|nr:uncharacterized protein N0V89_003206 [Didymosphaeria variabile]KAJ4358622.1 hypothetical protein N0V89_003206 [Didymosphaeria variabile]